MRANVESMGLLRLRGCRLFTWREREYGKGPRVVEVKPYHCVICIRELRRIEPPVVIDQPDLGARVREQQVRAPRRVMVVDDDADVRESLAGCLEDLGCEVVTATNGRRALEVLRSGDPLPGLILLDLLMPELDGQSFLQLVRQDPKLADLPIVIISAADNLSRLTPPEPSLRKPISLDLLVGTLQRIGVSDKPVRPWVMVVDDEAPMREALADTLEDAGCEVRTFANGKEALAELRSGAELPQLIFLDLAMPELDGYQFRDEQKQDPALSRIPVVVLTGMASTRPIDAKVLRKPISMDAVVEALSSLGRADPTR